MIRVHHLFISHSWTYADEYDRLLALLRNVPDFVFVNHSVPKDDPIHNARNQFELELAIREEMAPAEVVLVLAGVYSTYSKWINTEVRLAQTGFLFPKPMVAIEPFGAERTSQFVKENATRTVSWNSKSIVSAIRGVTAF